ncbi:lipopolysaccharide biosynthesis protein [Odoribacter splanchnicus]|jgi:O-antigen/teichoic acid export membrane protein|uniref:lipopolysaccharide biosynthesis protein n=1 Tax=Odoribacter splanchnicus TaxID=28118 RepID=UPI001E052FC2|nr:lipopolysaccharide biosynthesis protein [Odoribacter splanchnicus]MDB9212638.1 lipopolysaccharide biosynthesis protein [Odoribacter splanchnicus]MDB9228428.1 lipopolysaccharide biosynthesis protein [Odoribacter splanchnicus]MDB9239248.1 lipopolysaccharide biosynthesis protein [Odoribacter splanchnicus]MDB9243183.1 lipopolysaccharide biosynthesis protein [Odoribacter splanchnicus]HJG18326.1 lipopolysaccharide biosynthesis protein [Odoribacter splanchnicus]
MPSENTRRIAKNTVMLYIRMLLIMAVTLYTSRVVLNVLGVEDFGIYNVVGGIVVMFSFLNGAMATSTQRFLSFSLGKNDQEQVARVFSMSMTTHISIALIVLLLAETFGLWIFYRYLNIPPERMGAAQWVYQLSVLTFCISIIRVPYNAGIIAYERMSFYAYISIVEVCLKLGMVILLQYLGSDKLILYALLMALTTGIVTFIYKLYCCKTFSVCRYHYFWDKHLYKELISFSGWSLFGSAANVGVQQGINILLNVFFGVVTNAALGIANQVSSAVSQLVGNFQTAFNPALVKSYASGDYSYFVRLIFQTSRFSYFLLFIIALPLYLCMPFVLKVWLDIVPEYTVVFCRWMLVFVLIDAVSAPLWISVQAIGKIRSYQLLMSALIFLNIPLSWLLLRLGKDAEWVMQVRVGINLLTFICRIIYLQKRKVISSYLYLREVISPVVLVSVLSVPLPLWIGCNYSGLKGFLLLSGVSVILSGVAIWFLGLRKSERDFIWTSFRNKLRI